MKISELIKNLEELRKEYGDDIPVIVYDGSDPAGLEEISNLEPGKWMFFTSPSKGFPVGELVNTRAIRLT